MKMLKILSVLLAFIMLIGLMPSFTLSLAADITDLAFVLNGDEEAYYVSGCELSASGELIIPAEYNGKPVTSIGEEAFYNCRELTSVTIPDSVTNIGEEAFYGCTGLTNVVFSSAVTGIGNMAFFGCVGLTSITIPNSVTSIGSSAFEGCEELASITLPDSVSSVGRYAFNNTAWYNNYPEDVVVYIGKIAYTYKGLMPDNSVIGISGDTSCIADYAFSDISSSKLTGVTLPDSVTNIGNNSFSGCLGLASVIVPDSVISIGANAFEGCSELASIVIPDSVTSIGSYAFENTAWYNNQPDGLVYAGKVAYGYKGTMPAGTIIDLADGTKSITDFTFRDFSELASITISDSVTDIGTGVFQNCTGLTGIVIPNSVTGIGSSAFWGCTGLTSITIPDSVTSIGADAFRNCDNLTIHCNSGSFAEEYATEWGINYLTAVGIVSDTLTVSDGIISGLRCGDSVGATFEKLNSAENVKVFGLDGNEITDTAAKLGTGMVLKLYDEDGEVLDEVTVSVLGDIDGNGAITTDDARNVLRATVGLETPNNAQRIAADVTATAGAEPVTTDDARFILRVTVGLETL